ncbi:MAG: hypothetical protein RSB29_04070 [Alistipes sp.]
MMIVKSKFRLLGLAIFAVAMLTGCLNSDDNDGQNKWTPVEPGLYIYNAATAQNNIALQPADIAIRLAILRAEALKQGKADDLNLIVVEGMGNIKTLLFGSTTKIKVEEGGYMIAYAGGGGASSFDQFARFGEIRVRTRGVELAQTTQETPWTVELVSEKITFDDRRSAKVVMTSTGGTSIYNNDGHYEISFRGSLASIRPNVVSDWAGVFVWTPATPADLSFSALQKSTFNFKGSAAGRAFWTLNGTSALNMSYALKEGKFTPSVAGSGQLVSGVETCRLTDPADYNVTTYPAPDVKVTWTLENDRLSYMVDYNGHTVAM